MTNSKEYARAWREAHREQVRQAHVRYYMRNKERIVLRISEWKKQNREKVREQSKKDYPKRYAKYRERYLERSKKQKERNPGYNRAMLRKYRENVAEGYARILLSNTSFLPSSAWPREMVLAKQAEVKLRRVINGYRIKT